MDGVIELLVEQCRAVIAERTSAADALLKMRAIIVRVSRFFDSITIYVYEMLV